MNEGQKTGLFCLIAAVMLAVGLFVAWPTPEREVTSVAPGKELFESFKDPLAATSLKMVTFDEEQGQVETFEVRRDRESGIWSIPSRKGYPADAVEQMKKAANAFVGLQILDVQTSNPGDHEALGVVEPKLEDLEVGDVGVGRLVTFRDETQKDLASLIIGNPVKDEEGKIYVRKPGQDPVYVVNLDESALSTRFQSWIEDDLLKLSSINIQTMTIKDYAASMSGRGIALTRNYTAEVKQEANEWALVELLQYPADNPLADPTKVDVDPSMQLNKDKLNDIKNALDDLKIVDVVRKPDGMSSNLRADKDLISDNEAVSSLASRGFFPVATGQNGEFEVLSANGELNVSINDGVQYVLRFGNVSGLSEGEDDDSEEGADDSSGVNRYLLVTTRVDESQFPAPELKPVPQTVEELALLLGVEAAVQEPEPKPADEKPMKEKSVNKEQPKEEKPAPVDTKKEAESKATEPEMKVDEPKKKDSKSDQSDEKSSGKNPADEKPSDKKPADETTADKKAADDKPIDKKSADEKTADKKADDKKAADEKPSDTPTKSDETAVEEVEVEGSGEAVGEGQGGSDDENTEGKKADDGNTEQEDESNDDANALKPATPAAVQSSEKIVSPSNPESDEISFAQLSDDEKQERLEAEQEKILKENTRMLDARKDRLNAAKRQVSDLNARFANWYYVIPESTYRELRISREELLTKPEADSSKASSLTNPVQMPNFNGPQN